MESPISVHREPASYLTQANALLRKNLKIQRHNRMTNIRISLYPVLICLLLVILQKVINSELHKPKYKCGCACVYKNGSSTCENVCGIPYSTLDQVGSCSIPNPPEWPALLQVPGPEFRAVRTESLPYVDLPDESCRATQSCPATLLFTGQNVSLADSLASSLLSVISPANFSDYLTILPDLNPGSDTWTTTVDYIEPGYFSASPLYLVESQCILNSSFNVTIEIESTILQQELQCASALSLWRNSSASINEELFNGYRGGNAQKTINEILTAYDFLNSNERAFNVNIWYNSTYKNASIWGAPPALVRVPLSLNLVSKAYLRHFVGSSVFAQLEFTKEMPKPTTLLSLDFSTLLSGIFFTWVIELLFPIILTYLVYEKQHKLRIMMKMHGLGDAPYWTISYAYFLCLSVTYVLFFVIFGSIIGLKFFSLNDYSIQFVFYFSFINLQIVLAFLSTTFFSNVRTAQAVGYLYIFGSGLMAGYLLRSFIEDTSFPRGWLIVMEIIPAFALYRGLYEFSQYAFNGVYLGTSGMRWKNLSDGENGMKEVLIIIVLEWLVLLPLAYYLDRGVLVRRKVGNPLSFLRHVMKKSPYYFRRGSHREGFRKVSIELEKPDIIQEREKVDYFLHEPGANYGIICDNLKKVYPGRDGNPEKHAVQGVSLALPYGECFGLLGPNGAGKTSLINMMIGLSQPTSGDAFIQGLNIRTEVNRIYNSMGVCPQNDMLWEMLTGREHLLFYGRLKNLRGLDLKQSVEESLKSVNLFHDGIADKKVAKYSGGMKRRLSVAISLIGDPKVVYMDEPSSGLDPSSRNNLWNVVKQAKQNRTIILTTHSMEESEVLCDRLAIIVDGSLQCIGNSKELKARYGGAYIFTVTTSPDEEQEVENLVRSLSPSSKKTYHISGTQKYELPKAEIKISDVFKAMENAKDRFPVHAWGLADSTMEDVFIKVAKRTETLNTLS